MSILRTALRKAQIVTGYVHKCRRQSCGYSEEAAEGDLRRCPKCKMKLWPVGREVGNWRNDGPQLVEPLATLL